jgi:hypothetical protein
MVDLRKDGGGRRPSPIGSTMGQGEPQGCGRAVLAIVIIAVLACLAYLAVRALSRETPALAVKAGPVASAPVVKPRPPVTPAVDENATWTRLAWYWKFDPRKDERLLTRVVDQYGCAWWMEIGAKVSGYKYRTLETFRNRAYRADGIPDCPKDQMPKPNVAFLSDTELKAAESDLDDMTIVSRTTVKAGDRELIAYYREKRDEAARLGSRGY